MNTRPWLLLLSVFAIATCGLVYELIAGTLASYLLGDSVTQFSTIIGVYLFAMGVGSYLSRFVTGNLVGTFIRVEFLIALLGGCSASLLFLIFGWTVSFRIPLYSIVFLIGSFVGLEIPLLLRILEGRFAFKDLVSNVFSFDYIGALLASLLFPLVLVPHLGLVRSAFLFGLINAGVGLLALVMLRAEIPRLRSLWVQGLTVTVLLIAGFMHGTEITRWGEYAAFPDPVIYATSTPYQRIVLTRKKDELRLYLNSNLQFSSRDEYRYHEALVHPGLSRLPEARRVLILGGGDGLAAREVLRYPRVESITLVDLDPAMTQLFSTNPMLLAQNADALKSLRVHVENADAFAWLAGNHELFDFVIIDFPDPSNFSLGKLYTTTFYQRLLKVMTPQAALVVQSTSPFVARHSFWCVDATLRACGLQTEPYHALVPSFGEWGFILASRQPLSGPVYLPEGLRFVTEEVLTQLRFFPPDMGRVETEINRLNNQALVHYFDDDWSR
ncbi:spermidine synthase [Prosthecobacter debontii]|uniref:Polyamine aminopropyltransferase n=1 Tax=Prosthecobacter debontii TaxID=48467 RepID=A0A1T4YQ84_9BACT|nr:polyamine aminopropyltransferase [Prosthecobacter debontii]SKB03748.1 spermidine synthase [Prosthecobacter debontii]